MIRMRPHSLMLAACFMLIQSSICVSPEVERLSSVLIPLKEILKGEAEKAVQRRKSLLLNETTSFITITTSYGDVIGTDDGSVATFMGVPFASPPVGDLRWRAPIDPQPWSPLNATWWGPVCPQDPEFFFWGLFSGMSEDCLTLNVYMPSRIKKPNPPPGGYPIMIWFFGGGWLMGAGGYISYIGNFPEALVEDVILVTLNYRVSIMGFLAGDPLKADSSDGSVGNYGLQDMKQAVSFMVQTAAAWGGNPSAVTIFGESAGGASVSHFLTNPRTWSLYQKAIIESGPMSDWIYFNYSTAAEFYPQFAIKAGCPQTDGPSSLACLRSLPWENITSTDMWDFLSIHKFGPVIDGVEVLDNPRILASQGKIAPNVSVILGSNADEGSMFALLSGNPNMTAAEYETAAIQQFGSSLGPEVLSMYPAANYSTPFAALTRAMGDQLMTCPTRDTARWLTEANTGSPRTVYTYLYTHKNLLMEDMMPFLGVCHASELFNVWDTEIMLLGPGEQDLSKVWIQYWTNFAISGNPNAPGLPEWIPFGNATLDQLAILDTSAQGPNVTNVRGMRQAECDFWYSRQ